jgi:hypothetical protein
MAATNEEYDKIEEFKYIKRYEDDLFSKAFKTRVPIDDPLVVGYNYIFITAPRLGVLPSAYANLKLDPSVNPIERYYNNTARHLHLPLEGKGKTGNVLYDPKIIEMLSGTSNKSRFMLPLSNLAVKYTATDTKLETLDYSETWDKHKIVIGTSDKDSKMAGTLQIEYMENNNLLIMKTHNLWKNYIDKCFRGDIITPQALSNITVARNSTFSDSFIDYAASLYHFVVMPDGETLIYWAKYTGLFPINLPWSIFTSDDASINLPESVGIEYQYSFKEEMNLYVLRDFNTLSYGTPTRYNKSELYFEGSTVDINVKGNENVYPRIVQRPPKSTDNHIQRFNPYAIQFSPNVT